MTTATVKRSQIATFLNVLPSGTASYELLGMGITSAAINYNPQILDETYIHEDSASKSVESYAPLMPVEATAKAGDGVFDFIDGLRKDRAVLAAAESDVVNVWLYEEPVTGAYPAEMQDVAIQIDDFGGAGGTAAKINFTLNFIGDPVKGTFNPETKVFTPAA